MSAFFQQSGSSRKQVIFTESEAAVCHMPDMPKDSVSARQLTSLEMDAKAEPIIIEIAGGACLPSHFFIHKGEELGYILSGKLEMKMGATSSTARTRDLIYLRSEMPIQWKNPGTSPARLLWIKIR